MTEVLEYSDPRPATKKGRVRIALMQLYEEHHGAGMLPTSCRFLFYELVTRKIIAKGGTRGPIRWSSRRWSICASKV